MIIHSEELNEDMRREMERYEKETLTVLDERTSVAANDSAPKEISIGKGALLKLLQIATGWARFLM